MKGLIFLDKWEVNSEKTRVDEAEELILQLPKNNCARNTWLFKYGRSEEAIEARATNNPSVNFNEMFRKCDSGSLNVPFIDSKVINAIYALVNSTKSNNNLISEDSWFPQDKDFICRNPASGFYAMHFFANGIGVRIAKIGDAKYLVYAVRLLIGTPENHKDYINEELCPLILGWSSEKLLELLDKIKAYKLS